MDKKKLLIGIAVIAAIIAIWKILGPHPMPITGWTGKIKDVQNGNTLVMESGLKVTLLGLKPNQATTELFLKNNYVGKRVELVADSKGKQTFKKKNENVLAYVNLKGTKKGDSDRTLNRLALYDAGKDAYSEAKLKDSLEAFRDIFLGPGPDHLVKDLALFMKQRTFLILLGDGSLGTGFFINDKGLALTNTHVLDERQRANAVAVLYEKDTEDSGIYRHNKRNIKNILYESNPEEGKMDVTIFTVELEQGEVVPYFSLATEHTQIGEDCATLGNPMGFTASFSKGHISNYHSQDILTGRPVRMVQYEIPTNGGNSGGPVCNKYGKIIAVHEMGMKEDPNKGTAVQGMNFGIDILEVREVLDAMRQVYGGGPIK